MNLLARIFSRRKLYTDLGEEIQAHLNEKIEQLLAAGVPRKEAEAQARREFGNMTLVEEDSRHVWRWPSVENFFLDVRYALRTLRKSPGFTTVAVLTLALGIGANTAIFSVINAVLLRSLPFPLAAQIVDISARSTMFDFPNLGLSLADIADVRSSTHSFAALASYTSSSMDLTGDGHPERLPAAKVSADLFSLLGILPLHGRTFAPSDFQPGNRAVIIGYSLWRERFAADPRALGNTLLLDGQAHTIIGILAYQPPLDFVTDVQLWTPLVPTSEQLGARGNHYFSVLAKLNPHTRLEQAQTELDTTANRLAIAYPDADRGWSMHATPLKKYLVGDATAPLSILFCAVAFVLLIACANVSNLFLSRGWARRREFAVRAALGATRAALLRQLAAECLLIALAGGICAILAAAWALHGLRAVLPPGIPRLDDVRMDAAVASFALGASLLAAFLSGLAPALLTSRQDVNLAIKEGATARPNLSGHNFLRQFLVVGEVALALVLLVGATLAIQSFAKILRSNPGFRPDHLVTMRLDFPEHRFPKPQQAIAFVREILEQSRAIPGVEAASAGLVFPMGDAVAETTFFTEESVKDPKSGPLSALSNLVAPNYFQTVGIPLLAGRDFRGADANNNSPVCIVNEALAHKFFGSLDVVGRRSATNRVNGKPVWAEIVGISGNVRALDPQADPKPEVYTPFYQARLATGAYLLVRTKPEPMAIVSAIQQRVWSVEKDQPITDIKTVTAQIAQNNATPKSQSLLLGIFGGLGFILALIGVYGVMSYRVSQQTREIGIRMALGANPRGILHLVISHGLKLTLAGVAIGIAAAFVLMRFMRHLLFGISTSDPLTFAGVAVLLSLVALAACYVPARRAMRVDPLISLRYE